MGILFMPNDIVDSIFMMVKELKRGKVIQKDDTGSKQDVTKNDTKCQSKQNRSTNKYPQFHSLLYLDHQAVRAFRTLSADVRTIKQKDKLRIMSH